MNFSTCTDAALATQTANSAPQPDSEKRSEEKHRLILAPPTPPSPPAKASGSLSSPSSFPAPAPSSTTAHTSSSTPVVHKTSFANVCSTQKIPSKSKSKSNTSSGTRSTNNSSSNLTTTTSSSSSSTDGKPNKTKTRSAFSDGVPDTSMSVPTWTVQNPHIQNNAVPVSPPVLLQKGHRRSNWQSEWESGTLGDDVLSISERIVDVPVAVASAVATGFENGFQEKSTKDIAVSEIDRVFCGITDSGVTTTAEKNLVFAFLHMLEQEKRTRSSDKAIKTYLEALTTARQPMLDKTDIWIKKNLVAH